MVYKNNRYSNDETVSVLHVYDVHFFEQNISVAGCTFLEIRLLQLFNVLHKMKKHEVPVNIILKSKTLTHHIKCVYWELNMYMFGYNFAIFNTSSFWNFSTWAYLWIKLMLFLLTWYILHLYCTGDKSEKRCTGDKTEKRCTATFFLSCKHYVQHKYDVKENIY